MEDSRAKYCDAAALNAALRDSTVLPASDLALVRAWMARPAEWTSFATSYCWIVSAMKGLIIYYYDYVSFCSSLGARTLSISFSCRIRSAEENVWTLVSEEAMINPR